MTRQKTITGVKLCPLLRRSRPDAGARHPGQRLDCVAVYSNSGASLASTSSMIDAGTASSLRPWREPMSSARG